MVAVEAGELERAAGGDPGVTERVHVGQRGVKNMPANRPRKFPQLAFPLQVVEM